MKASEVNVLGRQFYDRKSTIVAQDLIGKILARRIDTKKTIEGVIVETEAYGGFGDPASHAYMGKTKRNEVMFREPGRAYVYFTYGAHYCLNLVTNPWRQGAGAVLIRAAEPKTGIDYMMVQRKTNVLTELSNGPGKLCKAFSIDGKINGADATSPDSPIFVIESDTRKTISSSPRIGISSAKKRKWRFFEKDSRFLSRRRKIYN
jgi:DNA-3-methyladenine glycosylase